MTLEGSDLSLVACAHELKTPLVLARQLSYELENCQDQRRQAELIRRIRLTAERSLRLADNLTKLARLEDGLFELEPIQISGLCQEVVDELSPLAQALQQKFDIHISSKSTVAVGHRELLRSLLMGLIDNAITYSSGQLVKISARQTGAETVIGVRDYGPIMELKQFRHLQTALGSQAMPISARPLSSGLGLLIAGKFAAVMRGRLSLSRHHSGGVTFKAHLPLSRQLEFQELL
jgi:signal transduction histidine kinase